MSVFVKKLVEKASLKKHVGFSDSLKPDDVNPHLVFHYGIPSASTLLAYDSIQQILAISTKDGQIKLFCKDGSQALLESSETLLNKFMQFVENQGILVSVNVNNHIQVWDLERKCLSAFYHFEKEITSFAAMRNGTYMYVGDSDGDVSVLRLDQEQCLIQQMKYHIPLSASHEKGNEVGSDTEAKYILPQQTAEAKRVLIIYSDGAITLWGIRESKVIFASCGSTTTMHQEAKKVTAACWACHAGSKVVVGYSNGDIILWSVPCPSDQAFQNELSASQITPIYKLNLGYKADKIPIEKLKWADADGKSSRLYVLGSSSNSSANLLQVVLLNGHTETKTIKLGIHPPESLIDMEITSSSTEQNNKQRRDSLLLLGRSSHVYSYDDYLIERYLVQCQNKSSPSLPKEVTVKIPYGDSRITITKFITNIPCMPRSADEDFNMLKKNSLPLFPFETRVKDGSNSKSTSFSSFSEARNLLITGHSSGAINFWDTSCPLLLPVASITQQSDNDFSSSGVPLTALHFSYDSHILVSGDQTGMVRIYTFKSEAFAPQSNFLAFQGGSKKGSNHIIRSIKAVKINGAVLSICTAENLKQLAVGSDQGYVSLIDPDGPSVLYQRQIVSEYSTEIISMHLEACSFHGFEKNVMIVATKDSSFSTLERDTGNTLSSGIVRPNKPSRALFTQILDGHVTSNRGSSGPDVMDINSNTSDNSTPKQSFVLLCSEKAVYAYSLLHLVQGVKKVLYKKKLGLPCYWASTFGSPSIGLILLFSSGKIEIRSLPELSLLKDSSITALTLSTLRPHPVSEIIVSSSNDGELIIVNGDQELIFVSILLHKVYRHVDSVSEVLNKDLAEGQRLIPIKEKKKGIFGSMIKENKGTKLKNEVVLEAEDSRKSIEELSTIFSTVNFPTDVETEEKIIIKEDGVDLDIDDIDIDIDDPKEKPKRTPVMGGLNRQNFTNTFEAIKGKLKHKGKTDKLPVNNESQEEKSGAVDQIKKKYGFTSGESSVANVAKTKLSENLRKLQGINLKTTEMQDSARSFSSMAKEVLRFAENEKKSSS